MYSMRFDMRIAPGGTPRHQLFRTALDMCEWAEDHGAISANLTEHHGDAAGYNPSPLIVASAMAARTERLPISIAIFMLPLYQPVRLAEEMCVLDNISGGRVSYVGGIGYVPSEYEMHGVDFHKRGKIAEANLEVLLQAVTGQEFVHEGRRIKVTPEPFTPGGPRIGWGGGSVPAARRAGKFGLNFVGQRSDPSLPAAYEAACKEFGRTPGAFRMAAHDEAAVVFVADNPDAAWPEIGPYLMNDVKGYAQWFQGETDNNSISFAQSWEELRAENRSHVIISVDQAIEQLRKGTALRLHPLIGGMPPELGWKYLRNVAEKAVPATSAK